MDIDYAESPPIIKTKIIDGICDLSTYAIRKEEHRLWKEKILSSSPPLRDAYILLGMKNHLYYMNNGSDLINLV